MDEYCECLVRVAPQYCGPRYWVLTSWKIDMPQDVRESFLTVENSVTILCGVDIVSCEDSDASVIAYF